MRDAVCGIAEFCPERICMNPGVAVILGFAAVGGVRPENELAAGVFRYLLGSLGPLLRCGGPLPRSL